MDSEECGFLISYSVVLLFLIHFYFYTDSEKRTETPDTQMQIKYQTQAWLLDMLDSLLNEIGWPLTYSNRNDLHIVIIQLIAPL